MYWMKYGFSRSLNCNSETDLWSSSVIARITGSGDGAALWPDNNWADKSAKKTAILSCDAYFKDGLLSSRSEEAISAVGRMLSLSSVLRSARSECSEKQPRRGPSRTPLRRSRWKTPPDR